MREKASTTPRNTRRKGPSLVRSPRRPKRSASVSTNATDTSSEQSFEVERILDHFPERAVRKWKRGEVTVKEYKVRWKGFPPANDTWEDAYKMEHQVELLVNAYWKQKNRQDSPSPERVYKSPRLRKLSGKNKKSETPPSSESEDYEDTIAFEDDEKVIKTPIKIFPPIDYIITAHLAPTIEQGPYTFDVWLQNGDILNLDPEIVNIRSHQFTQFIQHNGFLLECAEWQGRRLFLGFNEHVQCLHLALREKIQTYCDRQRSLGFM